jgi:hypothetical protein
MSHYQEFWWVGSCLNLLVYCGRIRLKVCQWESPQALVKAKLGSLAQLESQELLVQVIAKVQG